MKTQERRRKKTGKSKSVDFRETERNKLENYLNFAREVNVEMKINRIIIGALLNNLEEEIG